MTDKVNQQRKIMRVLKSGKTLTTRQAFEMGILRLASRISELRKAGYPIDDSWETKNGRSWKRYYLNEDLRGAA